MLQIENVSKRFAHARPVLDDINLSIEAGEIICLLGPSGCGKTTLLRIVAGLEEADQGHVRHQGMDLARVPVHQRNFGLMFQEFALFPHRTVAENIAFGLRMARWTPVAIEARVAEMLALTDLPASYADRTIFALSGGERQRVALARSLAPNPPLLMLDEPLGNLDRALRESLMIELRAILKRLGITALYVTHDQAEAYAVADRIVLMQAGRIVQVGAPPQIYMQPATPFVARFLGFENLLPARVADGPRPQAVTAIGRFPLALHQPTAQGDRLLLIHPQAATVVVPGASDDPAPGDGGAGRRLEAEPVISVRILNASFRGDHYVIDCQASGGGADEPIVPLQFELSTYAVQAMHGWRLDADAQAPGIKPGAVVDLRLNPQLMVLLAE